MRSTVRHINEGTDDGKAAAQVTWIAEDARETELLACFIRTFRQGGKVTIEPNGEAGMWWTCTGSVTKHIH
jgi:hypothetical protein